MADPKPSRAVSLRALPARKAASRQPPSPTLGAYPQVRMRRNRAAPWSRGLVAESRLSADDLIWPLFVQAETGETQVDSMPGVRRLGPDCLIDTVGAVAESGISAIAVFPQIDDALKSPQCEEAVNPDNLVCRAVRALKRAFPDLGIITDVALDPFNSLGQDGLLRDGIVLNDETVEILCRQAEVQAAAGSDFVAPSDMMDGRVGAIRQSLDAVGLDAIGIIAYSAKYASAFYGPFRDAVGSAAALAGDKKTYQLDPANGDEAMREIALDLQEGADMVMVKPGLPYLDIVRRAKQRFGVPTLVYQVSGEYSMMKAAAERGWLDNDAIVMETLMAFKRAGADAILTYAAAEAAEILRRG